MRDYIRHEVRQKVDVKPMMDLLEVVKELTIFININCQNITHLFDLFSTYLTLHSENPRAANTFVENV